MNNVAAPQQPVIWIGKLQLGGRWIWVVRLLLIGVIVWIGYLVPPLANWPMWLAAVGWIGFAIYWGFAARNSAGAQVSESSGSRRVHVLLLNVGQLLLFVPVPGLRQPLLPDQPVWIA